MKTALLFIFLLVVQYFAVSQDSWSTVQENNGGKIVLNYHNSDNFISDKSGEITGIEYEIFLEFEKFVELTYKADLKTEFKKSTGFRELYNYVKDGESGNFGACSFSITEERKKEVNFSPVYMPDIEVLITSSNLPIFKDTLEFLKYSRQSTFLVVPNTTYEEDYNS